MPLVFEYVLVRGVTVIIVEGTWEVSNLCITLKSGGEKVHELGKEKSTGSMETCHCCAEPAFSRAREVELENVFPIKGEISFLWKKGMDVTSPELCSVPDLEELLFL